MDLSAILFEMFLFDLVDTSGEDDSWAEQQAVAIIEPVAFPQYPALGERYVITSQDADGLRLFMDESLSPGRPPNLRKAASFGLGSGTFLLGRALFRLSKG